MSLHALPSCWILLKLRLGSWALLSCRAAQQRSHRSVMPVLSLRNLCQPPLASRSQVHVELKSMSGPATARPADGAAGATGCGERCSPGRCRRRARGRTRCARQSLPWWRAPPCVPVAAHRHASCSAPVRQLRVHAGPAQRSWGAVCARGPFQCVGPGERPGTKAVWPCCTPGACPARASATRSATDIRPPARQARAGAARRARTRPRCAPRCARYWRAGARCRGHRARAWTTARLGACAAWRASRRPSPSARRRPWPAQSQRRVRRRRSICPALY
jgi:hypothetical protein